MKILSLDRSVPFTGMTPAISPLGAVQRAHVGLVEALAERGHRITAATRDGDFAEMNGVSWVPLETINAAHDADVVIAWRDPDLLDLLPGVAKRVLIYTADPAELNDPAAKMALLAAPIKLLMPTVARMNEVPDLSGVLPAHFPPAATTPFFIAQEPMRKPIAVTCGYPTPELGRLIDLWREEIRPKSEEAEFHIYSHLLERALLGEDAPEEIARLLPGVEAALAHGVRICTPEPGPQMAQAFAGARVYLHAGGGEEGFGLALIEAAAAALPALGYAGTIAEARITNGVGGMVVPDEAAMVNMAVSLLSGDSLFQTYSAGARAHSRRWEDAVTELELLW